MSDEDITKSVRRGPLKISGDWAGEAYSSTSAPTSFSYAAIKTLVRSNKIRLWTHNDPLQPKQKPGDIKYLGGI